MSQSLANKAKPGDLQLMYYATALWIIVTYIQPQSIIPPLGLVRPGLIATVLVLFTWIKHGDRRALKERISVLHLSLIGVICLGVITAVNTYWLFLNFEAMIIYWVVFYCALPLLIEHELYRKKIFLLLAVSFGFSGLWAMTHGGRGQGAFLGDENDVALALSIGFCLCYPIRTRFETRFKRLVCALCLLLCAGGIVVSMSRGGFLGFIAGMFAVAFFSGKLVKTLLILVGLTILALPLVPSSYFKEMGTITDTKDNTRLQREYMWSIAWVMYKAHPIVGVGAGNHPYRVGDYENDDKIQANNIWHRSFSGRAAHSSYFTLIAELGTGGAIIFVSMVFLILRRGFALGRAQSTGASEEAVALGRGVAAGLIAFLIAGAFVTAIWYPLFWLLGGLGTATEFVANQKSGDVAPPDKDEPMFKFRQLVSTHSARR